MKTPMINHITFACALTYGHIQDIGQVTPDMKRVLERAVRKGRLFKVFSYFPGLICGISSRKTTFVRKDIEPIDSLVDHLFVAD